ncbi:MULTISPECIES: DUF2802 domain-containing protein [Oceanospirillaceae]|jgi:hypothetical protein|uniref:DUF2802 domain-containing protein n=1 Tax=Thalassolituus hydrocarboniclasticus TaxID=2742796 RepID=A0ABY6AC30_9GAMM|nr:MULTISPECIES: DUF2802 domain-containing protein [Thalassolituus]MAY14654.1 hypothetical protein [Oceanospirillaceae bacterium]PIQ40463.1 MAG: hypothetical protein COW58_05720 [Thalassolituus sp. CG17_big_fil_post_rev_8_21_14_2_50_53_8]MCA6061952.1 DUF2802 domain-containing protein [Thalassolituus sp. ST750PaO-4]MCB2385321.1 DUF2802 domain-containing protein [Thalassolituus alkanivorans]MCB2421822.1 DUF2802 domain-containing protein [Thalassolituus alkanivorans]
MASLSLMHWLLIGNMGLLLLVGAFMWSLKRQQNQDASRLDQAVGSLQQAHQAMSKSTIGMGRKLKQMDGRLQQAERKVVLPTTDEATFLQASRLVGLGATASDLVDSCGVARGEAELIVSLKRQTAH